MYQAVSTAPPTWRARAGFGLKLFTSILLLALLFWLADIGAALRAVGEPALLPLLFAVILAPVNQFISAYKWQFLLQAQKLTMRFGAAVRMYFIGSFAGLYLPTNIGGDALRLFLARGYGPIEIVAATIATERVTGIAGLLLFAMVGLALGSPAFFAGTGLAWSWLGVVLLVPAVFLAIMRPVLLGDLLIFCRLHKLGKAGAKTESKLLGMVAAMDRFRGTPWVLWQAMLWSIIFYGVLVTSQYCQLLMVGAEVTIIHVLMVAPLIPLISLVPISINGIGIAESAFVIGYVALGVPAEIALAAALVRRVFYSVAVLPGLAFWLQGKRSWAPPQSY